MRRSSRIWPEPGADLGSARLGERITDFMARTGDPTFAAIRDVLEEWVRRLPDGERRRVVENLRSDDQHFEGAFWEAYLHEAYRRSGMPILCHPSLPGSTRSPDFGIGGPRGFYLEATTVQPADAAVAVSRREGQVLEALRGERTVLPFTVAVDVEVVGKRSVGAASLIQAITAHLAALKWSAASTTHHAKGATAADRAVWAEDGWRIGFWAIPTVSEHPAAHPLMAMWGPARGGLIDNHSALRRKVGDKSKAYGHLDRPLVIAVLSNTEHPTAHHQVERALYGLHLPHPPDGPWGQSSDIQEDGFWMTSRSQTRRASVPQVIVGANLHLWNLGETAPTIWSHPDPAVVRPGPHPALFGVAGVRPGTWARGANPGRYFDLPDGLA